uniref:Uncharacterized protein n=1 Tax=Oryza sativa subsp. japonica TaxID=39947 RepID=Q2RBR9_ORYSJ|nr:hypothetical protein LOC_Os11g01060 [Oryza sativa Japonica Group]
MPREWPKHSPAVGPGRHEHDPRGEMQPNRGGRRWPDLPDVAPHHCRLQFPPPHAPPPAASPPAPWLRWSMVRRVPHGSTKKRWYLSSVKGPPCISLPRNLGATNQDKCDFCHRGTDQFSSSVDAKEAGGGGGEGKGGVKGEGDACVVSARVEGGGGNGYMRIINKEATLRVITSMMPE